MGKSKKPVDDWQDVPFEQEASAADDWQDVPIERPEPKAAIGDSAIMGAVEGTPLGGWVDEVAGGVEALGSLAGVRGLGGSFDDIHRATEDENGQSFGDIYEQARDAKRATYQKAQDDNPAAFTAGQVGGALATAFVPGAGPLSAAGKTSKLARAGTAALAGGASAAGFSDANPLESPEELGEFLKDTSTGALAGGVTQGVFDAAAPLVKEASQKAPQVLKDAAGWTGKKAAKIFTGVDEEAVEKYLANRDRIKAAPAVEEIKDKIDSLVTGSATKRDAARQSAVEAEKALDDAYKVRLAEMRRTSIPTDHADEVVGLLEAEKGALGALSEQADDALARSAGSVEKQDLLDFMDGIGKSLGIGSKKTTVSDEATSAVKKLWEQRQRIADGFDDEISHQELRDILRQVRKDIKWNQGAGEFNDTLNGARKEFTHGISKLLKDRVPEYDAFMQRMSDVSDSLSEMNRYFGTRERALSSLEAAASGKGGRAQLISEALERYGATSGNDDILKTLSRYRANKEVLGRAGIEDLREQLLPDLHAELAARREAAARAASEFEPLSRLGQGRTQNIVRQQGFKNPSIEDRRALEALEEMSGEPIRQHIDDRNTLNAFSKESTNGARKTLFGTIAGGAVGSLLGPLGTQVGGVVGGAAGMAADKYGPKMTQKVLDKIADSRASRNPIGDAVREVIEQKAPGAFGTQLKTGSGRVVSVPAQVEAPVLHIGEAVQHNPRAFGRFAPQLQAAAQRGNHALAVTHFLLMQNDPEYRDLLRDQE